MSIDLEYLEDCNRVRPDWTPVDGVASSIHEFLILLNTPQSYVWIALVALFFWKRNTLSGFLKILCSLILLANWIAMYELNDDLYLGRLGGCVGTLSTTIAVHLVVSMSGVAILGARLFRR